MCKGRISLALLVAAAGVAGGCGEGGEVGSAVADSGPVNVYPSPGTETASARTEVSFRGVAPDSVGEVSVTGSRSGEIRGELKPHADGAGVSFVPADRLRGGERISVRTELDVRDARDGDFRFTVGRRPSPREVNDGTRTPPDVPPGNANRFRSSDLKAPKVRVTDPPAENATPGEIFLSARSPSPDNPHPDGPMILDEQGRLVWFRQSEGSTLFDFRPQTYKGEPVLSWWEGRLALGWGYGEYIVLDQSYRELMRIAPGNGYRGDFHDMTLTPRDTALVMIYDRVERDLRSVGGPRDGVVMDNVIQEIEPETGRVLFEWHSLGNVPLEASRMKPDGNRTFDYFHFNSVDVDGDGNLLVSARNTCAVYKLSPKTNKLVWTLGGKESDFEMGRGTRFCFQHDARRVSDGAISLFDNGAGPPELRKASRAIIMEVDEDARTAELRRAYKHPDKLLAPTQGSVRVEPNGNVMVGWGAMPAFSEFSADGELLFNATIASGKGSYRAVRSDWTGRPRSEPSVAVQERGERLAVWASWNGATEVERWEILTGGDPGGLAPARKVAARGFETVASVPSGARHIAVRALGEDGAELGRSKVLDVSEDALPRSPRR